MRLHVALRQRVQPAQNLRRDRLQTRNDEQQMKLSIEAAGRGELSGRQRIVQLTKRFARSNMIGGGRELRTETDRGGLDLQPEAEHFVEFRGRERPNLKTSIGKYIDQAFGL